MSAQLLGEVALARALVSLGWYDAVEARDQKGEAPIDEIAEYMGQILVDALGEARDGEVGISGLGRVGGKPPAPIVRGQLIERCVRKDAALTARRELAAGEVSQLKPLMRSGSLKGSPEPRSVAGRLTVWNGTLSLRETERIVPRRCPATMRANRAPPRVPPIRRRLRCIRSARRTRRRRPCPRNLTAAPTLPRQGRG